jgi:hypothetical protein
MTDPSFRERTPQTYEIDYLAVGEEAKTGDAIALRFTRPTPAGTPWSSSTAASQETGTMVHHVLPSQQRARRLRVHPASPLVAAGLVLRRAPTPQRWYHHDQLGSVRIYTDQHGRLVGTASYTAYGKVAASTGELGSDPSGQGARFGYAGHTLTPAPVPLPPRPLLLPNCQRSPKSRPVLLFEK